MHSAMAIADKTGPAVGGAPLTFPKVMPLLIQCSLLTVIVAP